MTRGTPAILWPSLAYAAGKFGEAVPKPLPLIPPMESMKGKKPD